MAAQPEPLVNENQPVVIRRATAPFWRKIPAGRRGSLYGQVQWPFK